jgi:ribosomal protein S12 methylthiotransferase
MRGKHASKPIEQVVDEAMELAADGVRELIVVSQDTTYYGMDLYGEPRLAQLLRELERVAGIEWIRLMYFYPMYVNDRLLETIASSDKILPYLDMPLQHINDQILRRMSRRVTRRETERLLDALRGRIPNLTLRTTLITGFPGETDQQFAELLEFVREQRFQRLGVFTFSLEPDTPAARIPHHLPDEVNDARRNQLMEAQQQIAFAWNRQQIGRRMDVILDSSVPGEDNVWVGRSHADAPDIDSLVYVTGAEKRLSTGNIVECEIVAFQDYDLVGVAVGNAR